MSHYHRADFMLARLVATLLFGAACFVVGYLVAEARMKADPPPCKPLPSYEIKPMSTWTKKQQVRNILWSMRDKGAIK